jgi:Ribbon-helix-helix protein, copG family.
MSSTTKERRDNTISARVTDETNDIVDDLAEKKEDSKSNVVRRLLLEGLESREREQQETNETDDTDDDRAADRSVSALTVLGIVSIALAPTMLATGQIVVGGVLSMVAGVYGILWATATDHVVEDAIADGRSKVQEAGGLLGFFLTALREDRVIDDPDTLLERLTNAHYPAYAILLIAAVVMSPVVAVVALGRTDAFISIAGVGPVLGFTVFIIALLLASVFLLGVSTFAMLSVMDSDTVSAPTGDETGADIDPE